MTVVVVESPAKAKTINKYLGAGYEVVASFGHVRDLPAKDGSVAPDDDFRMLWEVEGKAEKRLSDIAKAVKGTDRLVLATDPDREGEAISWHVLQVLEQKRALKGVTVERVTFNAITKQAVQDAMRAPRVIDQNLVDAYLARRALDYLVGFTLSPVLWRKLPGAKSAGRVQSVALRLVCVREAEIEAFRAREYWTVLANLATPRGDSFEARLTGADGKKVGRLDVGTAAEAEAFRTALEAATFGVKSVEAKPAKRHPYPPFTTSTLQQEASRKLGFAPARTMQVAQRLYEGVDIGGETVGLITYMRTDGVDMAGEAIAQTRRLIGTDFGDKFVPQVPRKYTAKAKNAQEAHEAIRPTDLFRRPRDMARFLEPEQAKLYELIWVRTVASQMESAELMRTTVDIEAKIAPGQRYKAVDLRATGQVVMFPGFLEVYQEGRDDGEEDEESRRLPKMSVGEALTRQKIETTQHFTEPPPRYSEASLVKRMEELGIGRPSTYASILQTLKDRDYVTLDKKKLVPQDKGRLVVAFLESFFGRYVEYDFTASLEEDLDRVSAGDVDWKDVLRAFWRDFTGNIDSIKELRVKDVLDALDALLGPHLFPDKGDGADARKCPSCADGRLSLKLGKFGAFVGCSNYPTCRFTRPFAADAADAETASGPRVLGKDPETGLDVTLREGRFGTFLQLGEPASKEEKPKRSSLPRGMKPADVDLATALQLLSLPRLVGIHPETGDEILAGIGQYGPYLKHGKSYTNLPAGDDVLTIGLNRAVVLIAEKAAKGPRSRFGAAGADEGRTLGDHPTAGGPIVVKAGRYGPYVAHDGVNATLPKDVKPDALTIEQAVALLSERAAKGGGTTKKKPGRGKLAKADAAGKSVKAKGASPGTDAATGKKGETVAAAPAAAKAAKAGKATAGKAATATGKAETAKGKAGTAKAPAKAAAKATGAPPWESAANEPTGRFRSAPAAKDKK